MLFTYASVTLLCGCRTRQTGIINSVDCEDMNRLDVLLLSDRKDMVQKKKERQG